MGVGGIHFMERSSEKWSSLRNVTLIAINYKGTNKRMTERGVSCVNLTLENLVFYIVVTDRVLP